MSRLPWGPTPMANGRQVLRPMVRQRPHLVVCWFLVCQAVGQENAPVTGLARLTPRPMAAWHLRRLLTAASWHGRVLWGGCPWRHDRSPVAFALVRRPEAPRDRSETRLVRWMLVRLRRPAWAESRRVGANAAWASQAHGRLSQPRGACVVMAWARPWCVDQGHTLTALVTPLPKHHEPRGWGPLEDPGRRRPAWPLIPRARLRPVGDVTLMLRQQRRTDGLPPTTILVTHLPDGRARPVVDSARRRWSGERLINAWQGATGLGQPQVTQEPPRSDRSVAIAVLASRLRRTCRAHAMPEHGPWSALTRTQHGTWPLGQAPSARSIAQRLRMGLQARSAA
jgi:hypothetical protein